MINFENPDIYPQTIAQAGPATILVASAAGAEQLAHELQDRGLKCRYMYLTLESDTHAGSFTYQQMKPALSQAQDEFPQSVNLRLLF